MKLFVKVLNMHLKYKANSFKILIHRLWKYSIFFFDTWIILKKNTFIFQIFILFLIILLHITAAECDNHIDISDKNDIRE